MAGKHKGSQARIADSYIFLDSLPYDLRACVHEFGTDIVRACMHYGVTNPAHIRDLVKEIWAGARQPMQRQSRGTRGLNQLDWVLCQQGVDMSARRLVRTLDNVGWTIISAGVTPAMVEASMSAIDGMGLLSKHRKHEIRLKAAIKVGRDTILREMAAA